MPGIAKSLSNIPSSQLKILFPSDEVFAKYNALRKMSFSIEIWQGNSPEQCFCDNDLLTDDPLDHYCLFLK